MRNVKIAAGIFFLCGLACMAPISYAQSLAVDASLDRTEAQEQAMACAQNEQAAPKHGLDEIGIFIGYGDTSVKDKDKYRIFPLAVQLGVSCDKYGLGFSDWIERGIRLVFHKDIRPAGLTTFIIEPFLSTVTSPDSNIEIGFNILLRYGWPVTKRITPYIFGGAGIMFMTQHLREQSTQYNFTPQIGAGVAFGLTELVAVSVEYRYRHFSNASLKLPNDGVNMDMVYVGVTRKF